MLFIKRLPMEIPQAGARRGDPRVRPRPAQRVPDGATYAAGGAFAIETLPGYWVEFTAVMSRGETPYYPRMRLYNVFYRSRVVQLRCVAGDVPENRAQADAAMKRILPYANRC
jgi:hypothetical protein